jgi:hypothetical protein
MRWPCEVVHEWLSHWATGCNTAAATNQIRRKCASPSIRPQFGAESQSDHRKERNALLKKQPE